jgi:hypothetical protein
MHTHKPQKRLGCILFHDKISCQNNNQKSIYTDCIYQNIQGFDIYETAAAINTSAFHIPVNDS